MFKSELRTPWAYVHKRTHTWPFINPRIWTLTYITVVARPASNAVTIVAANQVPAGVGIDTGFALAFIGI